MHQMDTGALTEHECLEAFSLAQRTGAHLEPRHQRILDALIYAGYLDPDGTVIHQLI